MSLNPSQATSFLFFSTKMITFVLWNIFEWIWYSEYNSAYNAFFTRLNPWKFGGQKIHNWQSYSTFVESDYSYRVQRVHGFNKYLITLSIFHHTFRDWALWKMNKCTRWAKVDSWACLAKFFMTCSKLEAMYIYVVTQSYGHNIWAV